MTFPRTPAYQDNVDALAAATFNDLEARAATQISTQVSAEAVSRANNDISQWLPNTSYVATNQSVFQNQLYVCTLDHTSTSSFDHSKWSLAGIGGGGSGDSHTVLSSGTVAGTSSVTMSATIEKWVTLTLSVDHVCTVTMSAGGKVRLFVSQDTTGGHTFSLSDGSNVQVIEVATAASSQTMIAIYCPDGSTLFTE